MLLEALEDFGGTLIFVSHDRYFVDKLATKVINIGDGEALLYPGNYEEFSGAGSSGSKGFRGVQGFQGFRGFGGSRVRFLGFRGFGFQGCLRCRGCLGARSVPGVPGGTEAAKPVADAQVSYDERKRQDAEARKARRPSTPGASGSTTWKRASRTVNGHQGHGSDHVGAGIL